MRIKLKLYVLGTVVSLKKRMYNEYNLDWEQNPLKILGVTFTGVMKLVIYQFTNGKQHSKNLNNKKEVKLRDFQFKINNQILVTNTFLFKIKKEGNQRMLILQPRCRKYRTSTVLLCNSCEILENLKIG